MKKYFLAMTVYCVAFLMSCSQASDIDFGKSQIDSNVIISSEVQNEASDSLVDESSETTDEYINVFISGCVNAPDVYRLKKGALVKDAVDMAGGFSENASRDYVNLARELTAGEHIIIPDMDAVAAGALIVEESATTIKASQVNINTASREELMSLPGIGESRADAIIEYRNKNSFLSVEDIMNISGIKEAAFNKIKDRICTN